jgi:hypothetical protein
VVSSWRWGGAFLGALLSGFSAQAQGLVPSAQLEGQPRITVMGGWRLTVNDTFAKGAALLDHPLERPSNGGPQGTAIFGYGVTANVEVTIDLFLAHEQFKLKDLDAITAVTYGALVGVRLHKLDFAFRGFDPSLGIAVGPTFGLVTSNSLETTETFSNAYAASVGFGYRINPRWGLQLEYRFMLARAAVADLPSISIGGNWFSLGLTFFFPQEKASDSAPSLSF